MFLFYFIIFIKSICNYIHTITSSSYIIDYKSENLQVGEDLCIFFNVKFSLIVFNTLYGFNITANYSTSLLTFDNGDILNGTGIGIDFGPNYGLIRIISIYSNLPFNYCYTTFFSSPQSNVILSTKKISSYYSPNPLQLNYSKYFIYMCPNLIRYYLNYNIDFNENIKIFYKYKDSAYSTYSGPNNNKVFIINNIPYIFKISSSLTSNIKITTTSNIYLEESFMGEISLGNLKWLNSNDFNDSFFPSIPDDYDIGLLFPIKIIIGFIVFSTFLSLFFKFKDGNKVFENNSNDNENSTPSASDVTAPLDDSY